ncbi:MAG: DUF3786 domain-containing protein [Dehalococcoidia bacterium]|nr:MAG: DUF3786 domain-containing protein [Dehalococcoidia bacterium]
MSPLFDKQYWQYGHEQALALASKQLGETADIEGLCQRSGARCADGAILLDYLGRRYRITCPEVTISPENSQDAVPIKERILMLHYLLNARGTPLANQLITFREIPEGANYYDVFHKRAIKPIVDFFGKNPPAMVANAAKLGGRQADFGDASVTLDAFPRVPITFVLWRGDEELPAEGSVLFDASVADYLSSYTLTELCETIAWKMVKIK